MKFDLMAGGLPLRRFAELARDAAAAGFSGIVVTETSRTAYLSCAAGALAADIDLLTGIAVAFPRSPMISAQVAWELAEATGGRFRLGLGSQVRAHIERRFGASFDPAGPRLREHVSRPSPPPARTPRSSGAGGSTPGVRSPSTGRRRTTPSSSSSSAGRGSRPGYGSARRPATSRGWRP